LTSAGRNKFSSVTVEHGKKRHRSFSSEEEIDELKKSTHFKMNVRNVLGLRH
jgi:hypothetical protein